MTTHDVRRPLCPPLALAFIAACVGAVAAAQQAAPPQPDPAALERQAEINKRPDTPGTGAFGYCEKWEGRDEKPGAR